MITVTIEMHAIPAKRKELLQAIQEMDNVKRKEKGFIASQICTDEEDLNLLTLIEEWESQEDVNAYLQSDLFYVLGGAMQLLTSSSEMTTVNEAHKHS
jgi:quinol monooxygenase YgiN